MGSKKKRNRPTPAQRPVTEADLVGKINFHLGEISKVFRGQLKVTVIARHPSDPNAHFFMTGDQIEPLKAMIDQQYALAKGEA